MSFRRRRNPHDEWVQFRDSHRDAFRCASLPESIWTSEGRFVQFLSEGRIKETEVNLRTVPDEQFRKIEVVVNAFCCDGWLQSSWKALADERLRRFGRYA